MEYRLLQEINGFRVGSIEDECIYPFKNVNTPCHHSGFQFGQRCQFQIVNCMKCGGYLASNDSECLTLKNVCNCHSRFKEIKLIDLTDSVELTESVELIESNDLFHLIQSNSLQFFYEEDSNEDFLP